jgi:hypothetical protein
MTYTAPCSGYAFPNASQEGSSFDPIALAAELAAMEASFDTEEYDESLDFYGAMEDWELLHLYELRCAEY